MIDNIRRALAVAGVLLAAALIVGVLVAIPSTHHDIQTFDNATRRLAVRMQNGPTTDIAKALSFIGGTWVNWAVRVAAAVVLIMRRKFAGLIAFALIVATSEALIGPVKAAFGRQRPPGSLISTSGASFPSGHAVASAVTALGIVMVLLSPGRTRRRWAVCAVVFVVLMALSRIYLRAHWLSDALAGALLGLGLAVACPAVVQLVRNRRASPVAPSDREDTWENA